MNTIPHLLSGGSLLKQDLIGEVYKSLAQDQELAYLSVALGPKLGIQLHYLKDLVREAYQRADLQAQLVGHMYLQ